MCIISVGDIPDFEFKYRPFSAVMKNFDDSLPCFSVGRGILQLLARYMSIHFQAKNCIYSKSVRAWDVRFFLIIWEVALLI